MLRKKENKKGISPLVATVVLVGIVVAVIVVITLWGKGVQEDLQQKQGGIALAEITCTSVSIDVSDVSSSSVTVSNNGEHELSGVVIVVKGGDDMQSQLFMQEIAPGDARSFPFTGIPGVGVVEEVTVIPSVGLGINRPCTEQKKEVTV
ncbi:MAG: archaellin/type IV pilin N-terminal domain-containing protein [Nanoarchaeota archaeon]